MKRKKSLLLITLLSLLSTNKVYAACTEAELNHFKEIESTYKVTTDFDPNTKEYVITYYMDSLGDYEINIELQPGSKCQYVDGNTIKCTGKNLNGDYKSTIIGYSDTCNDELKQETGTIPKYNEYYGSEECQGIEEFALCQKDYTKEITEEDFKSRTETYKKTTTVDNNKDNATNTKDNTKEDNTKELKNDTFFARIKYYVQNNLTKTIIIAVFIILLIITAIITIKSIQKSRRLE